MEIYTGGIIVFVIKEYHNDGNGRYDKYLSVFAKFDPDITEFEQLDYDTIKKMPYVLGEIALHIENKNEADKFVYIGNFQDFSKRNKENDDNIYHILSQLLPPRVIASYFEAQKGYWNVIIL